MAHVVYSGVSADAGLKGSLFQGMKFWLSRTVPLRVSMLQQVKDNGGVVVELDKDADVKIVDHLKKGNAPGTYSYQFIERSVRNGVLEDLEDHRAGPPAGTIRPVGAIDRPASNGRRPFTAEDDRVLREWVADKAAKGVAIKGNEIYKELGLKNPRHPWQSWRDRYIKHLMPSVPYNAPPTPPIDQAEEGPTGVASMEVQKKQSAREPEEATTERPMTNTKADFGPEEAMLLLPMGDYIVNFRPEKVTEAWEAWAEEYSIHSAQEWQKFWEETVLPVYLKKKAHEARQNKKAAQIEIRNEKSLVASTHSNDGGRKSEVRIESEQPSSTQSPKSSPLPELSSAPTSRGEDKVITSVSTSKPSNMRPDIDMNSEGPDHVQKRKSDAGEHRLLMNSTANEFPSPLPKRRRMEQAELRPREIPSTSEPPPLADHSSPMERAESRAREIPSTPEPPPLADHFSPNIQIDLRAEDPTPTDDDWETEDAEDDAQLEEDNHAVEENRIEDSSEDEYEDADQSQYARGPSPSLSEPRPSAPRTKPELISPNRSLKFVQIPPVGNSVTESASNFLTDDNEDDGDDDEGKPTLRQSYSPVMRETSHSPQLSDSYFVVDIETEDDEDTAGSVASRTSTAVSGRDSHADVTSYMARNNISSRYGSSKPPIHRRDDSRGSQDEEEEDDLYDLRVNSSLGSTKRLQEGVVEIPATESSAASDAEEEQDEVSEITPAITASRTAPKAAQTGHSLEGSSVSDSEEGEADTHKPPAASVPPRAVPKAVQDPLSRRPSSHLQTSVDTKTTAIKHTVKAVSKTKFSGHDRAPMDEISLSGGSDVDDMDDGNYNAHEPPSARTSLGISQKAFVVSSTLLRKSSERIQPSAALESGSDDEDAFDPPPARASPNTSQRAVRVGSTISRPSSETIRPSVQAISDDGIGKHTTTTKISKAQVHAQLGLDTSESGSDDEDAFEPPSAQVSSNIKQKAVRDGSTLPSLSSEYIRPSGQSSPTNGNSKPATKAESPKPQRRAPQDHRSSESGTDEDEDDAYDPPQLRVSAGTTQRGWQAQSIHPSSSSRHKETPLSTPPTVPAPAHASSQASRKTTKSFPSSSDSALPKLPAPPNPTPQTLPKSSNPSSSSRSTAPLDPYLDSVDEWITVQTNRGIDFDTIERALMAGGAEIRLAEMVLKALEKGKGIPKNIKGIWTEADDECVERADGRDLKRVLEKHGGKEAVEERRRYLKKWKE